MKKPLAALLAAALLLAGCSRTPATQTTQEPATPALTTAEAPMETTAPAVQSGDELFTRRDQDPSYDESDCVYVELLEDTAAASSDAVRVSGSTVTITEEASYIITGTLNGMIVVDAPEDAKVQLVLDGASVHSDTSAALYILEADKVFLTLADGSENSLSNGGSFTTVDEHNIDGAVFSRQDLTINGSGSLTVTSPAGHGIVCKDDLVLTGGALTVTAASHGLDANDSIRLTGETALTIDSGKDGLHAEHDEDAALGFVYIAAGTLDIQAQGDGISASAALDILDGTFRITAGSGSDNAEERTSAGWGGFRGGRGMAQNTDTSDDSGESMKGLKAVTALRVSGGSFTMDTADDCLHSNGDMTITGGDFTLSSGDDALHADDTLTVTGGTIAISRCYEGLEALHLSIQGGDITLTADDDGLNAAGGTDASGYTGGRDGRFGGGMGSSSDGSIVISGGTVTIRASGDGIDANGTLEITGGTITVTGPNQGDTATLDFDVSGAISGGTFLGTGASMMAQTFSGGSQGVLSVNVGAQTAGTALTIADAQGNILAAAAPELDYSVVIYSSPEVRSGEQYTITVGTTTGNVQAD